MIDTNDTKTTLSQTTKQTGRWTDFPQWKHNGNGNILYIESSIKDCVSVCVGYTARPAVAVAMLISRTKTRDHWFNPGVALSLSPTNVHLLQSGKKLVKSKIRGKKSTRLYPC